MKTLLALAALGGSLYLAPAALAQPAAATASASGIDLTSADGRARFDRRIERAVNAVCGDTSSANALGWKQVKACREATLASARSRRDQMLAARVQSERLAAK